VVRPTKHINKNLFIASSSNAPLFFSVFSPYLVIASEAISRDCFVAYALKRFGAQASSRTTGLLAMTPFSKD
jgi:hypothetical protein